MLVILLEHPKEKDLVELVRQRLLADPEIASVEADYEKRTVMITTKTGGKQVLPLNMLITMWALSVCLNPEGDQPPFAQAA